MAHYTIHGGLGSPYSMKMRAIFRYRRLPHIWKQVDMADRSMFAKVKAPVIPIIEFPDGSSHNDSTPMIFTLEKLHSERSIIPDDAGHAFLAYLLEEKKMKPSDLWTVLPKSRVSEILNGKRGISKAQAKQLAELFRVPVDLFL